MLFLERRYPLSRIVLEKPIVAEARLIVAQWHGRAIVGAR
jgi:hypothetical protein